MNTDETMSDSNIDPTTKQNIEAMFGASSPTGSQNNPAQALAAQIKSNMWNTNKFREEYEAAKSRLSDQKFNITDYPDPLLPRQKPFKEPDFDPKAEDELRALIARIKSENR